MAKYKVLIKIMSDQKGKKGKDGFREMRTFEPGDTVVDGDFPKSIISNWVEINVLKKIKPANKKVEKSDKIVDNKNDAIKDGD